jgi:hypothetical protein
MLPKKFSSVGLAERIVYLIEHFKQGGQDEIDLNRTYTFTHLLDTPETSTEIER